MHHLEHELDFKEKENGQSPANLASSSPKTACQRRCVFKMVRGIEIVVWVTPDFKYVCWRPVGHEEIQ